MTHNTILFAAAILISIAGFRPVASAQASTKAIVNTSAMTYPAKQISISINKPFHDVYRFASNPANFPKWVKFMKTVQHEQGNRWMAQTDMGAITIDFAPENDFGVIDHLVTAANGTKVTNPLRVIANGEGSEIIFTLFHMPNRTDAEFSQDEKLVEEDLSTVKKLLEAQ